MRGGLLELPFDPWGRISSVRRMLWQPRHGRPIVAGKVSLDPAWYTPAGEVFERFPSEESVLLLRAWGITSVLDARPDVWRQALPAQLQDGLLLRAEQPRAEGAVRLFEVVLRRRRSASPSPCPAREAGRGPTRRRPHPPSAWRSTARSTRRRRSKARTPRSSCCPLAAAASALQLDYGAGRFSRVPVRLQVQALVDGRWRDVTREASGSLLRPAQPTS